MATNSNPNPKPSLLHEIGPDGIFRENSVIAYTEKIIEEEQIQLRNVRNTVSVVAQLLIAMGKGIPRGRCLNWIRNLKSLS